VNAIITKLGITGIIECSVENTIVTTNEYISKQPQTVTNQSSDNVSLNTNRIMGTTSSIEMIHTNPFTMAGDDVITDTTDEIDACILSPYTMNP
jgi:hypothetical protein